MSDLYLVLRSRLAAVAEWVYIPTHVLRERKGLSYEAMGRVLNVSSKTYERYEKAGRVPPALVRPVAVAVDIEIEEPRRIRVVGTVDEPAAGQLLRRFDEIEAKIDGLDRKLDVMDNAARLTAIEEQLRDVARTRL
jgi:transcriptional regulator with XRE-family HTH domain